VTVRAIIFDLGHTLWDIGPQRGALELAYADMRATLVARLKRNDLPPAAKFQLAVRDALRDASETYFTNGDHVDQPPSWTWVDRGCRALGVELDRALLLEITPPLFATEIDSLICGEGTQEALVELSASYRLGCVTNTLADTATIRTMLRNHAMEHLMGSVVVSADEGWRKPHPSLFEKAMRELGTPPEQSVFVGDSPLHDIAGAKAVGMRTVLTRQYVQRALDGSTPAPDAIIDHVRELGDVVRRLDEIAGVTG
jgi:putative hydrolase of the HAD superfamily